MKWSSVITSFKELDDNRELKPFFESRSGCVFSGDSKRLKRIVVRSGLFIELYLVLNSTE